MTRQDQEFSSGAPTVAFACADGFATTLGSFDGRDRRTLITHGDGQRPEQLFVSIHEQLHEELHWSTAWGVTSAMSGLLAHAGKRHDELAAVSHLMNGACRQVHETFATTVSSGAIGVPTALELLADNPVYLNYLNEGLALGGNPERWPWQFRESAVQMLLRMLMQPAELSDVAERGFSRLGLQDVSDDHLHPDRRLALVRQAAPTWWAETFATVLAEHPNRGGDSGGTWARTLPDEPEAMEELKSWEETVLIPALGGTAHRALAEAGLPVLGQAEYSDVVEELRTSFLEIAPEDWDVEVFLERRRLHEEMLGAERETLLLSAAPAQVYLCEPDDLPARVDEFLLEGPDGPHVLAALLDRGVMRQQFTGLETMPDGPPLMAMVGNPVDLGEARRLPVAMMRPGLTPRELAAMFSSLPVLVFSTLRASLDQPARDALLDLDEAYVLVDLPLRTQLASWLEQAGRVRLRVMDLEGPRPMNLIVLQIDGLPSLWMICFRSDGGIGELAQLLDRHPGRLTTDLDIPPAVARRIGMLASWLHRAWHVLEEMPE